MAPAHPLTRIASIFGVGSVVLFFKCSSLENGILISLNGMVVAVVAIALAFIGHLLSLRRRPRSDTSETRVALVSSCFTIVLTIVSWAAVTHRYQIASTLESWAAEDPAPRTPSERPAWMTAPKDKSSEYRDYRVALEHARSLY